MKKLKAKTEFGKWILSVCRSNNIGVRELSNKIGIDREQIYGWIREGRTPSPTNLIFVNRAVAKLTGRTEEEIYRETSKAILKDS